MIIFMYTLVSKVHNNIHPKAQKRIKSAEIKIMVA